MKTNIFLGISEENKGITLIEIVISIMIFAAVVFSAVFIFKESLYRFGKQSGEKKAYSEITGVFNYIEKYITAAMCNDKKGPGKIDFKGRENFVRFVAPFYEGKESDLAKFAFYFIEDKVKASIIRIDSDNPDFSFPENFSGAQTLGEYISVFSIEYHDGTQWESSWDTSEMKEPSLPESVKLSVASYSDKIEGERIEKRFTKIIYINR
ncbi:MAG TPA: hypothetical protein PKN36_04315 [bacterium]|nr:hypothetical protein [bacterium]